jgi:hypothetical protein
MGEHGVIREKTALASGCFFQQYQTKENKGEYREGLLN